MTLVLLANLAGSRIFPSVFVVLVLVALLPSAILISVRLTGHNRFQWRFSIIAAYLIATFFVGPTIVETFRMRKALIGWAELIALISPVSAVIWTLANQRFPKPPNA